MDCAGVVGARPVSVNPKQVGRRAARSQLAAVEVLGELVATASSGSDGLGEILRAHALLMARLIRMPVSRGRCAVCRTGLAAAISRRWGRVSCHRHRIWWWR